MPVFPSLSFFPIKMLLLCWEADFTWLTVPEAGDLRGYERTMECVLVVTPYSPFHIGICCEPWSWRALPAFKDLLWRHSLETCSTCLGENNIFFPPCVQWSSIPKEWNTINSLDKLTKCITGMSAKGSSFLPRQNKGLCVASKLSRSDLHWPLLHWQSPHWQLLWWIPAPVLMGFYHVGETDTQQ
jgi:hypothetical protein